jgi:fructose-specific phosphotransferase system IIA component
LGDRPISRWVDESFAYPTAQRYDCLFDQPDRAFGNVTLREYSRMRLTDILKPQNIKVPLVSTGKSDAIGELVQLLADNHEVNDAKKVLDAVLEREATRTTGIGNGLAIPHGKCTGTDHLVMAIGRPTQPIDFQAIDGRPVNLIWLLTSPPDKTGPHIHALARISRLMTIDRFRQSLNEAQSPQDIFDAIVKQESAL